MPSISGIHHLSLSVTDLERSVRWYSDVLGFAVAARLQRPGSAAFACISPIVI